jgi:hypothetical protein
MFQPRAGFSWDVQGNGKTALRASAGIYFARQNMLSQVGSVTTNGVQQQTIFASTANMTAFGAPTPTWPGVLAPTPLPVGQFPLFTGIRVFDKDYKNPRVYRSTSGTSRSSSGIWPATWTSRGTRGATSRVS